MDKQAFKKIVQFFVTAIVVSCAFIASVAGTAFLIVEGHAPIGILNVVLVVLAFPKAKEMIKRLQE